MAIDQQDYTVAGGVWCKDDQCWTWRDEHGRLHRVDGPAVIYPDGDRDWFLHGERHRVDGPAVIRRDSRHHEWFLHGQWHRVDGPAVNYADGSRVWCLHGLWHRVDGPAAIYPDGSCEWWLHDRDITKEVDVWMQGNGITPPLTAEQQVEFALRWL
jgi:hypothetical protein